MAIAVLVPATGVVSLTRVSPQPVPDTRPAVAVEDVGEQSRLATVPAKTWTTDTDCRPGGSLRSAVSVSFDWQTLQWIPADGCEAEPGQGLSGMLQ